MKVRGPGQVSTGKTAGAKRKSGTNRGSFSEKISSPDAASSSKPVRQTAPIASIDAILSLQEAGSATDGRSKGIARAENMLDALEEVRKGLLLGLIPRRRLKALAELARSQREQFSDPQLAEILDEIELRAEVEIAKFDRDA